MCGLSSAPAALASRRKRRRALVARARRRAWMSLTATRRPVPGVLGLVDLAHAALAEEAHELGTSGRASCRRSSAWLSGAGARARSRRRCPPRPAAARPGPSSAPRARRGTRRTSRRAAEPRGVRRGEPPLDELDERRVGRAVLSGGLLGHRRVSRSRRGRRAPPRGLSPSPPGAPKTIPRRVVKAPMEARLKGSDRAGCA